METIVLKKIVHNHAERIGIEFRRSSEITKLVKLLGAAWSRTFQCWHLPYTADCYRQLLDAFEGSEIQVKRNTGQEAPLLTLSHISQHSYQRISLNNREEFKKYSTKIVLKGYSPGTLRTYTTEFRIFLQHLKNLDAQDLEPDRLASYFLYCHQELKLSANTIHSRLNAVKFYYESVLHRERFFWEVPRPKKHK